MNVMTAAVVVAAVVAGAITGRRVWRRARRVRQLRHSEAAVSASTEDGRLPQRTGRALLRHLEDLRCECSGEADPEA